MFMEILFKETEPGNQLIKRLDLFDFTNVGAKKNLNLWLYNGI